MILYNLLANLKDTEKAKPLIVILIGFLLVGTIGIIDLWTGYQISFSIFYFIPIIYVTWKSGKWLGLPISLLSALTWLGADLLAEHFYTHPLIPYWNAFMRFGVFILVTYLLDTLKRSLLNEQHLARIDYLTRVANSRSFTEALNLEMIRARRYRQVFSLAYLDLDNFKKVNDEFGHERGDTLLREIAAIVTQNVRKTDLVGRLGGDEFAILLPQSEKKAAAEVLGRIRSRLQSEFRGQNLPVTLSIGCITFHTLPDTVDEVIQKADQLMYEVKKSGKNDLRYEEHRG